jgi:putative SOS response-associated peptidase YedK
VCGRYTLTAPDPAQLRARFPIGEQVEIRPRYNVAPTDDVLAVTTDREGQPRGELLRWGLVPPWADSPAIGPKLINARVETVADKPAFRRAFERFRCLIIADGFYEWQRPPGGGPKQAFRITRDDGQPFAFAGLWSVWRPGDGPERPSADGANIRSCSIITRPANPAVAALHDRMPVILDPATELDWLDAGTPGPVLHELLRGLDAEHTRLQPVGPAVNDVRNDGPECLDPPAEEAHPSLF